ncbi:thioredoxin domain-containing protein [Emticicia sp. C21]|uniref:thioredoxin domain-containing protein n=1 Tax=Emticicia sp. C21 TaxID=2302915 RepID=UPI000E356DE7|nr:thioredoxin domain-containing protein [Emticicia sp. C21]RFS16569.1 thioredoxin [Emticicia sp. C21]
MKKYLYTCFLSLTLFGTACSQEKNQATNLSANTFSEKIIALSNELVLDVRTPEEYAKGHLIDSKNINWKDTNFANRIEQMDKSKPVFVYCLSGIRSAAAAKKMREMGFKEVYELDGGIVKWRAANLPETTDGVTKPEGMTQQQFSQLIDSDKLVLVDFYADWCEPCKRMEPYLKEISTDMKDKVQVIRINADDNQALCKSLGVDALPVLQLYKNKTLQWSNAGFIEKGDVVKQLE